jgi:glycosyltransferase involved in cell wall biosynthesis
VGGVTRVNSLVRFLAPKHDVTVFAHSSGCPDTDAEAIADLKSVGVDQRLFEIERPGLLDRMSWVVSDLPYFVGYNRNPGLKVALAELDRRVGLDVVHVELAYLAPLLGGLGDGPVRFLAEQETMSVVVERLRRVPLWSRTPYETFLVTQAAKVRRFETRVLAGYTRIYAITPEEAAAMREISGREIGILPHVVNTRNFTMGDFESREPTVLFVGNYGHRPNLHGLLWFVEKVWPSVVSSHPEAVFEVVGPGLDEGTRRRLAAAGIRVMGRVDDLAAHYQSASVFVNPILSGGGMRGKVLESFSCGLPVVSTRMGMEGVEADEELHYLEADHPRDFARQIGRYLATPGMRRGHGMAARELAEKDYDVGGVFARLEDDFRVCVQNIRNRES